MNEATTPLETRIERALLQSDFVRRPGYCPTGQRCHKEWLHFVVHADGVELLVNLSLVDDTRPQALPGREMARLVVLSKTDAGWDGDIELFEARDVDVSGGEVGMRFGVNEAVLGDGVYRLRTKMRHRPIAADLRLTPVSFPALSNNIRLEMGDRPINWMVVPRLTADGWIEVAGQRFELRGAPAYHDHNWGHFEWGKDFAWEWGFSLPSDSDNPWSVVFVRLCDRAHTRALMQGLFLWKREAHHRIFRADEMTVTPSGFLRSGAPFKLPRVMNVLSPGSSTDVPAVLEAHASDRGDKVHMRFEADDVAQVCIPNDTDDVGVTIINEVGGCLELTGAVRGEPLNFNGRAMFEFVRGG